MSKKSAGQKAANKISSAVIQVALRVIIYTIVIMLFVIIVRQAYSFGYSLYAAGPVDESPGTDKTFTVDEGTGGFACMKELEQSGLISSRYAALFQEFFYQYDVTPGTYTLNTSMTIKEILEQLDQGPEETVLTEETQAEETPEEYSEDELQEEEYGDEDADAQADEDAGQQTREIIIE